jgi:hypothetical protein
MEYFYILPPIILAIVMHDYAKTIINNVSIDVARDLIDNSPEQLTNELLDLLDPIRNTTGRIR